jgi:putative component of membrane protein insertase Oxa1/YidC/SpoIIIJ protein YidD
MLRMDNHSRTWVSTSVDANMPTHRMLLLLFSYIFHRQSNNSKLSERQSDIKRPSINLLVAIGIPLLHILIALAISGGVNYFLHISPSLSITIVVSYCSLVAILMRSKILIFLIKLYQLRAPFEIRSKCKMTPCCSNYMILSVEKFGVINGVNKGVQRLRRCEPTPDPDYP